MKTLLLLYLCVITGCTTFQHEEDLIQEISKTYSIVLVTSSGKETSSGNFISKNEVVITCNPEDVKVFVDAFATPPCSGAYPWIGYFADVVFLDRNERPLAMASLMPANCIVKLMPCIRKGSGYAVPNERWNEWRYVHSRQVLSYVYKFIRENNPEYLLEMQKHYKWLGLNLEEMIFDEGKNKGKNKGQASKNGTE